LAVDFRDFAATQGFADSLKSRWSSEELGSIFSRAGGAAKLLDWTCEAEQLLLR
jgi:hypothetical protein